MRFSWKNVEGILVYPHFKRTQKIRTHKNGNYSSCVPDLEDPITYYFFISQLIEKGVKIEKSEGIFKLDGLEMTDEQLKAWISEKF